MKTYLRFWFAVLLWSVCLNGCSAEGNLSPEFRQVVSQHVQQEARKAVAQEAVVAVGEVKAEAEVSLVKIRSTSGQTGAVNVNAPGGAWVALGFGAMQLIAVIYLIVHERGWRKEERTRA